MCGKVTKEMAINEIISKVPEAGKIFFKKGLHCVGCMAAQFETMEQGCQAHGMSDEDIDKIIEEINNVSGDSGKDKGNKE